MRHQLLGAKSALLIIALSVSIWSIEHVQCHAFRGRSKLFHSEELDMPRRPAEETTPRLSYLHPYPFFASTLAPTTSQKPDTCPCVLKPGTNQCMYYDPRFMASSVEQAILYFPDLQLRQSNVASDSASPNAEGPDKVDEIDLAPPAPEETEFTPPPPEGYIRVQPLSKNGTGKPPIGPMRSRVRPVNPESTANPGLCDGDIECFQCSAALLNRLGSSGLLQGDELIEISQKFGLDPSTIQKSQANCNKYHFGIPKSVPQYGLKSKGNESATESSSSDPELDALVQRLREKGEKRWREKQEYERKQNYTLCRQKRQAAGKSGNASLGQQFKIDCTKRGEPVEQGSNWVGLCNVCWAWRKLPSTYFPQYLNELICDADTKCMSGFASCQQRYKSVDILQNTGTDANPTWKQVTISVANYCDCEVESGSSLHNFVAA